MSHWERISDIHRSPLGVFIGNVPNCRKVIRTEFSPQTTIEARSLPSSFNLRQRQRTSSVRLSDVSGSILRGNLRSNLMDRFGNEINLKSIRALEEQIKEHEITIVKLKRTRNSLLSVSKLPPEVLGDIFSRNVTLKTDFGAGEERSYNFLLVCHYWYEVASCTPDVWSYWGNTPKDWARCYSRSRRAPLDLVLDVDYDPGCFDAALFNALRNRANQNLIRRVHLRSGNTNLLNSVVSSLTPESGGTRLDRMESLILGNEHSSPVDSSGLFSHRRFPNLQHLYLIQCAISSWDHLKCQTGALTHLRLSLVDPSPSPTTIELLSVLSSNPALQHIALYNRAIPNDVDETTSIRVPLHHLNQLTLQGDSPLIFRLIDQLDHPATLDKLALTLHGCTTAGISQTIGPYLREYLRCRRGPRGGLGIFISCVERVVIHVCDADGTAPTFGLVDKVVVLDVKLDQPPSRDLLAQAALGLITHVPEEKTVFFEAHGEPVDLGDICTRFPNLKTLNLARPHLPALSPRLSLGGNEIIPYSLQNLSLQYPRVDYCDWNPLKAFLTHCASSGKRLDKLKISYAPHMCLELMEGIRGLVREFQTVCVTRWCPFGICSDQNWNSALSSDGGESVSLEESNPV